MSKETPGNQIYIFFDLDGVLADFDRHAREQNKYTEDGKVKWGELDHQWWATMPAFFGAKKFYSAVRKLGKVKFLTAPVLGADCFSGKAEWVQKFASRRGKYALMDLIICPAKDKYFLASPNHILVDDREKNIKEWVAAGGIGVLHKGDFAATLKALELAVEKMAITKLRTDAPKMTAPKKANRAPWV